MLAHTFSEIEALLRERFPEPDEVHIRGATPREEHHHLVLRITSEQFVGQSLIDRQRMIHQLLGKYFESGEIHALPMKLRTPEEAKRVK